MNRNHFWKLVLIVLILAWSYFQFTPVNDRDLVAYFRERAIKRDERFTKIFNEAQAQQKTGTNSAYTSLLAAVGTNDLNVYFPFFEAQAEANPTTFILNKLQRESAGRVKRGIDLAGGTSFLVEMDTTRLNATDTNSPVTEESTKAALNQAIEVLRKRVDRFGVAEPVIQPEGNNRIRIQLPGLSEAATAEARTSIQKAAYLEFRLVHEDNKNLLEQGIVPPGYEMLTKSVTTKDGKKIAEHYLVKKKPEMVGGISRAIVTRDNIGRPEIAFTLDSKATTVFGQVTKENVGHQLAIVLDGLLQTAPNIKSPIEQGSGVIEGDYSEEEAFGLANVLENPLKTPVHVVETRAVDPSLGNDSIASGIKASLYGIIAVAGFMAVYYFLAGLIADVALIVNVILLLGIMCSFGTTLTMPGIAGIVLTVGMAVDANVLIFERIREESAKGKSLRGALQAGYDRAFGTIFDSHVTTLISSIILIVMGTGPVKGFGVTLTIGVAVSLFTALVVTRLIFDFLIHKEIVKSLPMLHLIPSNLKLNFMKLAVPAFVASWLLIVVGLGYGAFVRGSHVFGVEFVGGETITLSFDQAHKVGVDEIRKRAQEASRTEVGVGYQKDISTATETLRVVTRLVEKDSAQTVNPSAKVISALQQQFPEAKFNVLSTDSVGPSVGQEIQETAIIASLLAMFGILVYVAFRYEFSFAVAAVVAIIHDVLMTLGCYFLSGRELNATTVAALLTIIGFSINDTIVIFDRIREDLKLGVRGSFRDLINQALNQTLSRTIITSGTVFLATLSLYVFGGGVINDFAFTFLVGIITGTYSSIYIASALVLFWHKGQRPAIGSAALPAETVAAEKTAA
ncbi:MAG: protein translocase subunit SecD [Verrucomicrobiota bacterium]